MWTSLILMVARSWSQLISTRTHNSSMGFELAHLLDTGKYNNHLWVLHWVVQHFFQGTFSWTCWGLLHVFAHRKSKHGGRQSSRSHIIWLSRTGGEGINRKFSGSPLVLSSHLSKRISTLWRREASDYNLTISWNEDSLDIGINPQLSRKWSFFHFYFFLNYIYWGDISS